MIVFEKIGGEQLFFLFLSPITGFIIESAFSKKATWFILLFLGALFIPFFLGYYYVIPFTYRFLGILASGCLFSFFLRTLKTEKSKIASSIVISVLLCACLGFFAILDAVAGTRTIEETYKVDDYRIEYVVEKGYAGRPLITYQLNKYAFIPIFIQKVETVSDEDSIQKCYVIFPKHKLVLDKYHETVKESTPINIEQVKKDCER